MRDAEGALASDGAAAGIQIKALAVAHLSGSEVLQMFLGRIAFSRKPKGGPQSLWCMNRREGGAHRTRRAA
jgi:hypothetical protein